MTITPEQTKHEKFAVGTRVTFKYDKRIRYGTVVTPFNNKEGTTVEWDNKQMPTTHYRCGELRAVRQHEEIIHCEHQT